jgi:general secretion pathway protein M
MRTWWQGLSRRERTMTALGAALVAAALLYLLAIEPAWKARARLEAELPRLRAQAAEVDGLAQEAGRLKGAGVGVESATAARTALEQSAARGNLGAVRIAVLDERRLSASAKGVPAWQWLAWLEETARESRLRIAQVKISRTATRAVVDAEATFEIARP